MQFPKNIDISNISYGSVKVNDKGGKSIYIGYNGAPLIVQTPFLKAPFGMSTYKKEDDDDIDKIVKYTVATNLSSANKACTNFVEFLNKLDSAVLEAAVSNSKDWFGKQQKEKVISAFYTPLVKHAKDKETGKIVDKYPAKFSIPVIVKNNEIITKCFNSNKESVTLTTIPNNSMVRTIMQCTGIWIVDKKFGISWKVLQMEVAEPDNLDAYAALSDDDDLDVPAVHKPVSPSPPGSDIDNDIDNADEEEQEILVEEDEDV